MTLSIDMTENNFQRLAALLLFADRFEVDKPEPTGPLPWEIPTEAPPELELDYGVIRSGIIKRLPEYVKRHSTEEAKKVIQSFGAETINAIPKEQLLGLYQALDA